MAQSLKAASKKAQHQALVDSIGGMGTDATEFDTGEMLSAAENAVGDFIERVVSNLDKADAMVTGKIANINIQVKDDAILITGNKWVLYQDRSVNGSEEKLYNTPHEYTDKRPPSYVFEEYIKRKNIQLRNNEDYGGDPSPFSDMDGDDKAIKSAAYAMATKIFKSGFEGSPNFWSAEIPQLSEDLRATVKDFTAEMLKQNINAKLASQLFVNKDSRE